MVIADIKKTLSWIKRLLLPLLAALALTTYVNAESTYLLKKTTILTKRLGSMLHGNSKLSAVPMKTMPGCEEAGLKIVSSERLNKDQIGIFKITGDISFECVESK